MAVSFIIAANKFLIQLKNLGEQYSTIFKTNEATALVWKVGQKTWVQLLALPLTSCMTLNSLLHLDPYVFIYRRRGWIRLSRFSAGPKI